MNRFLIEQLSPLDENFYNYTFKITWADDPISNQHFGYYVDINNESNGNQANLTNSQDLMLSTPTMLWFMNENQSDFDGGWWFVEYQGRYHRRPIQDAPALNERRNHVAYIQFVDANTYIFLSGFDYLGYENTTVAPTFHFIENDNYNNKDMNYNDSNSIELYYKYYNGRMSDHTFTVEKLIGHTYFDDVSIPQPDHEFVFYNRTHSNNTTCLLYTSPSPRD